MKKINWSIKENRILLEERDISFEIVEEYIKNGHIVAVKNHPNQKNYPGQKIFILDILEYIYLVPFVENEEEIFLKTIIPSRKVTKESLWGKNENNT
ncbi:MAG: toxin [Leptospira sp.]|nr:toxin [Leptospira sp.]